MNKIIKNLTKEQTKKLAVYKDKWIKIGFSTDKTNYARALSHIPAYYQAGGLAPPKSVIFASSPYEAMLLLSVLKNLKFTKIIKSCAQVHNQVYAQIRAQVYAQVRAQVHNQV
jgi:hypothetical protein